MATLSSTDFLAVQFPAETLITVDPNGAALAVTVPGLHSFMSTKDIAFTGPVMIMKHPQNKLSGFVCDDIQTLA